VPRWRWIIANPILDKRAVFVSVGTEAGHDVKPFSEQADTIPAMAFRLIPVSQE